MTRRNTIDTESVSPTLSPRHHIVSYNRAGVGLEIPRSISTTFINKSKSTKVATAVIVLLVITELIAFGTCTLVKNPQEVARLAEKKAQFMELIEQYYRDMANASDQQVTKYIEEYIPTDVMWPEFNWRLDTEQFLSVIQRLDVLVQATNNPNSVYYKSTTLWSLIKDALNTIQKKMNFPPTCQRVPFGTNWYQFSISLPRLITAATFIYESQFKSPDDQLTDLMRRVVLMYLPTPVVSLGWPRNGPNIVMMSVPYFGAHILLGDFLDKLGERDVKTVLDTANFTLVTSGEGLYPDAGFWFHRTLRGYNYIITAYRDYVLVNKLWGFTAYKQFDRVFEKTEHPTIPLNFGPWFTREPKLSSAQGNGKLGFYRIDSIAGVSCKTPRWLLSFNGQHPVLCAYESDRDNYMWGQFWVFARMLMYKDTEPTLQKKLITHYPGVLSFANQVVELRSRTDTTDMYFPSDAMTWIAQIDNLIGFYTRFKFNEVNLKVWEMILVDEVSDGYYCMQWVKPIKTTTSTILKSVNLGRSGERYNDTSGVVYKFPNDYTHIKIGHPELNTVRGDNGADYKSLQLVPDKKGYLLYATVGKSEHKLRSYDPTTKRMELFDAELRFDDDKEWLILTKGHRTVIGIKTPNSSMVETFHLEQTDVHSTLGLNVIPMNGILTNNGYKFLLNSSSLSVEFNTG